MKNQMELSIYGNVKSEIIDAPWHSVALCRSKADAYRLTMTLSRVKRSDSTWAELLGISKGYLSQILNSTSNSPKYMPPNAEVELMRLSGNKAFNQWVEMAAKGELLSQKTVEQETAELEARLAELRKTA